MRSDTDTTKTQLLVRPSRLFIVETNADSTRRLRDSSYLLDLIVPDKQPQLLPPVASEDTRTQTFLFEKALQPFLTEVAGERGHELDLIERSVRTCFEELIAKRDAVLSKHLMAQEQGDPSAIGLAELEAQKLQELQRRRDLRLNELARQRALSLQGVGAHRPRHSAPPPGTQRLDQRASSRSKVSARPWATFFSLRL